MNRLDRESRVVELADALGLDWRRPVEEILSHCNRRIDSWLRESRPPGNLDELEKLVSDRLSLQFEEFADENQLDEVVRRYVAQGEFGLAGVKATLAPDVFATLTERRVVRPGDRRFVAFIDLRGDKGARRYFTRWHEIAHLLTLVRQLELPFHRSTTARDPVEQLMDIIAGEVGFYDPLFRPAVNLAAAESEALSFEVVASVRTRTCPSASFHAALIACAKRWPRPVVTIEAGAGLKKAEARMLSTGQLSMYGAEPEAKLRALSAVSNDAAKIIGLRIYPNMRIPESSVLADVYARGPAMGDVHRQENLSDWGTSDGTSLPGMNVIIEARRVRDRVIAVVNLG